TLREIGTETERRQTLGRGLRLPVAKTGKGYERIADQDIAVLTVIANESYQAFAQNLQNEYNAAGVAIGQVRPNEFAKLLRLNASGAVTDEIFGYQWSLEVFQHLENSDFIKEGKVTSKFLPDTEDFSLYLPDKFKPYEIDIIGLIHRTNIEKYVKPKSKRALRKFNKGLYATPEFEKFWNTISQKTTYRVTIKRDELINKAIAAIKEAPKIEPLCVEITRAGVKVLRGGAQGQVLGTRIAELKGSYDLPDIIGELQEATSLTRKTLGEIIAGSGKLDEFIGNPNDFIAMTRRCIKEELTKILVEGVEYEKIGGSLYELRELQADGLEEKERFLDQMYQVQHQKKTDFDYVVYESDVEEKFAKLLDGREDIKLFMKLPKKFKIDTPVSIYNPDWAIIKHQDGEDHIYMIRETKSTQSNSELRQYEPYKIKCAQKHFKKINVNYARSTPERWSLDEQLV
ncbi:MAG: hypothetical protein LBH31_05710, partial [Burkholderiaceae bacterium]|nr:hypothetical protein [Burkholderiaceae bacterium]